MKTAKKLRSLIALAVLAGSVAGSGTAWAADGVKIEIQNDGSSKVNGSTSTTYSAGNWVGIDGTKSDIGDEVNSITTNGAVANDVYGIKIEGDKSLTVNSLAGGIDVTVNNNAGDHPAFCISLVGTKESTISGIGSLKAARQGEEGEGVAYGIRTSGSGTDFNSAVSFTGAGSSISASNGGYSGSYGIEATGNGSHSVTNLGSISATTSNKGTSCGICTYSSVTGFVSTVSFVEAGGTITAESSGNGSEAYGISASGTNKEGESHSVTNLASITAKGTGEGGKAYGISTSSDDENFSSAISFVETGAR